MTPNNQPIEPDGFSALFKDVIKYGVGSVIALWLTYWVTFVQDKKIDALVDIAHTNSLMIQTATESMSEFKRRNETYLSQLVRLSTLNCKANAKNQQQADNCESVTVVRDDD